MIDVEKLKREQTDFTVSSFQRIPPAEVFCYSLKDKLINHPSHFLSVRRESFI